MTVIDEIRSVADKFAELPAVIEGDQRWTYAELYARVDRLSNAFLGLGVEKGDRLMVWLPNCHEALECELACLQIGAVWVTLNSGLTWPEVENVLASTEPSLLVTTPELLERVEESASAEDSSKYAFNLLLVRRENSEPAGVNDFESVLADASSVRPRVSVDEADTARLRYTSGTTAKMKAAVLSHRAYSASMETLLDELPTLDSNDRVLHAAPMTHATAAYMYPILMTGGANVILPQFDVEEVLATIERERISVMFVVPTILHRLSVSPDFATRDLSSLRSVSYGAAPTPDRLLEPALKRIGPALLHIYGLTEALHPVTTLHRDEHWEGNPRLGSVGKPTKLCELKVVDDAGSEITAGEVGEFLVRGPIAMDGYWQSPEDTAEVMQDGWVATGDLGYCDEDGYYWIVDRKKDVIITGGLNVYSHEVEELIATHEAVQEVAVIGLPHLEWGEQVHAVIRLREGAQISEGALHDFCRAALAGYKTPKAFTILDEPMPRNSTGKILKREVVKLVMAQGAT